MLLIRPVKPSDFDMIRSWEKARDVTEVHPALLPKHGVIVSNVACGFLMQTDTIFCFFENFISNPMADKDERIKAFEMIVKSLESLAKDLGYKSILAITKHPAIYKLCDKNSYKFTGDFSIYSKGVE